MHKIFLPLLLLLALSSPALPAETFSVPILLYHRFGPIKTDDMTVSTAVFASHLRFLQENGYTVIPLRRLLDRYRSVTAPLPPKPVVIVADDAHRSVYSEMLPLVKQYRVPVTLFTYPSAISNARYAMTWEQLRELKATGLFDIQSHTYWHPNFRREKRKLSAAEYDKLVAMQLGKSKAKLEKELGGTVDLLAWPFGIYDEELLQKAVAAGYIATFSIERRPATPGETLLKLPRFLMQDSDRGNAFARIVGSGPRPMLAEAVVKKKND